MDIYFKDSSGNRLGYISGVDVRDNGGNRLGYINGNEVRNTGGSASNIEMCAAGFLLFGLEAAESEQKTISHGHHQRENPEGFLGWAIFILFFLLYPFYENIKYFKYTAIRREWWGDLRSYVPFIYAASIHRYRKSGFNYEYCNGNYVNSNNTCFY